MAANALYFAGMALAKKGFRVGDWCTYLKYRLRLPADPENMQTTVEMVRSGATMTGANLWVLVMAIFTASLGLNVNSTPVIIGAMLISPLMGPIMAIGMGGGYLRFCAGLPGLQKLLPGLTAFSIEPVQFYDPAIDCKKTGRKAEIRVTKSTSITRLDSISLWLKQHLPGDTVILIQAK